jgi:hypothetical protein
MNEYQVPLVERLKSVPDHARFVQEEKFSSAYYPVGYLCHQAADRIAELEKENAFIKNNLCTPLLGPMFHGDTYEDSKAPQPKPLSNEEIDLVREVLDGCVSTIKMEIDQERQTFKGYEHCSNLPALESELKAAEKAMEILRKASEE